MPLPDERPRQSVANLIGRFETTQQKRGAKPDAPKPIQLPGKTVSGLQDRKTSLGPDLAKNLAKTPPTLSRTTSDLAPETNSPEVPVQHEEDTTADPATSDNVEETPAIESSPVAAPSPVILPEEVVPVDVPEPAVVQAAPSLSKKPSVKKTIPPSASKVSPKINKARSPPPSSMPKSTSTAKASHPVEHTPIRPQHTGNSSIRGAVSPTPHYMTPIRPQNTGGTDANLRAKTPVTKPRTNGGSGLMKPTASSLAKARPPVAAAAKSTTSVVKKVTTSQSTSDLKQAPPATRARTVSSTVPFPSARKAKPPPTTTAAGNAAAKAKSGSATTLAPGAPGSRQTRISQSSSKGPSAAALAARARVNAPPVPAVPVAAPKGIAPQADVIVASMVSTTVGVPSTSTPVSESANASPVDFPSTTSSPPEPISQSTTIVEPVADGSGNVVVADNVDGITVAPPAAPLTQDALETHDHAVTPAVAGEGDGGASVVAVFDGEPASTTEDATSGDSAPVSFPVHTAALPHAHTIAVVPSTATSPTFDRDQVLGPVPSGQDLKDDAPSDTEGAAGDIPIPDMDS